MCLNNLLSNTLSIVMYLLQIQKKKRKKENLRSSAPNPADTVDSEIEAGLQSTQIPNSQKLFDSLLL